MPGEQGDPSTVAGEFPDDLGGAGADKSAPASVSSTDVNDPFPNEGIQVINDIFGGYIPSGVWPDGFATGGTSLWIQRGGFGGGAGTGATTPGTTQIFSSPTTLSATLNTPSGMFVEFTQMTFQFQSAGGATTFNATIKVIENGSNFFPTRTTFTNTTTLSGITAAGQTTTASFTATGFPGSFNYIGVGNHVPSGSTAPWRFFQGSTSTLNLQFSVSGLTTQVTPAAGWGGDVFTAYTTVISSISTLNS